MITWDASGCDVYADADAGRDYELWRIARCVSGCMGVMGSSKVQNSG